MIDPMYIVNGVCLIVRRKLGSFLKEDPCCDKNNLGSLVKIINDSVVTSPRTTSQEQSVCAISLYGGSGTNAAETTGNRDMRDLIAEMVAGLVIPITLPTVPNLTSILL